MGDILEITTVAISKRFRPALDVLADYYSKEARQFKRPTMGEVLEKAVRAELKKRGYEFIPAPDDAPELVPIIHVKKGGKNDATKATRGRNGTGKTV